MSVHELVMPYVTVTSRGGPHDDDSFVAGWVCGRIDAQLSTLVALRGTCSVWIPPEVAPQVDLIAMRHHYLASLGDTDPSGTYVEIALAPMPCTHNA